ncbi:hypothetical protein Dimus_037762, partial [Dionaea muscipula]
RPSGFGDGERGRPRKRGGLARVVVSPRVAVNPRVVSRVVDRVEEVAIVDPADDSLKGVQLEEGIEVRHPSGRDELKSMGETKLPIELWGDDEGELVENSVTVEADLGSPFLCALWRKPEEIETELRPLAGNRDMNRGTPLSRRSTKGEQIIISAAAIEGNWSIGAMPLFGTYWEIVCHSQLWRGLCVPGGRG